MKLPKFEYAEPKSIRKACQLLEEQGDKALAIAGGTDLMMALKNRLKVPDMLVDLKGIPRLNQINYSDRDGLKVGAMVTLRHLAGNAVVKEKYPLLARTALEVGTVQLQAMGTIGGNLCQDNLCLYYNRSPMLRQNLEHCYKLGGHICHAVPRSRDCWATYSGDLAPSLFVLQSRLKITGPTGKKVIPLNEFYSGNGKRPNILKPGELLTEIQVPPLSAHSGGTYLKLRPRKAIDYPLLGIAVTVTMEGEDGKCKDAALALTAVERAPLMIKEATQLKGKKVTEEVIGGLAEAAYKQAHPLHNLCEFTPKYRKEMVKIYVTLAVQQALQVAIKRGGAD